MDIFSFPGSFDLSNLRNYLEPAFFFLKMGLFNRKNTKSSNHSGKKSPSINSDHIQSPRASRPSAGASFGSLPAISAPKAPDPSVDPAAYLRSIFSVRERCSIVTQKARQNQLKHFDVDLTKWRDTAHYVVSIIKASIIMYKLSKALTSE